MAKVTGLTSDEVILSREKHGDNTLTPPQKEPLWKQYIGKFNDPLIIILMVAGFLSICISFYEYFGLGKSTTVFFEPVGIFIAIFLATGLAFVFELKANKEFSILNQVNDDEVVHVIREGNAIGISKREVVVGDVVILDTGTEIPADAELLEATSLLLDESTLTGETTCRKDTNPERFDEEATFPTNHVMRGTKIIEGHALARVFAVGDMTENGKVFEAAQIDDSVQTPLNEQLDRLGGLITKASYVIASLIIIGRMIMFFSAQESFVLVEFLSYFLKTIMIAVTLIVVAVPEGLPMAVTLSLAYSMRRMLKTNNLVRKMHACETMGAATIICTDKTGTLTQNQMKVYKTNFYGLAEQKLGDDATSLLIKESIAVNCTAQLDLSDENKPSVLGNPTEGALLLWLKDQGIDYKAVKSATVSHDELPFSTLRKCMASVVQSASGERIIYVKGAPEIVLGMCQSVADGISEKAITEQLVQYQNQAMRTLGFAYQILKDGDKTFEDGVITAENLVFIGIVAIADPVREDVPQAIEDCITAGLKIKIVTGDTTGTAKEIGRQIGLWTEKDTDENIITGPEFAALSHEELLQKVDGFKIIARARPLDKERLVKSLQERNEVVAVTGDGTNDAPALNAAHVGLSMGDGTAVAKEASDITIVDNSFTSIGRAVMWGRSLYQNIQRFILFQLTVNVTACLTVLVGAFMGTQSPLTVTQMLWVNLIMDTFAAMALASLPPDKKVMQSPPRSRDAFIIDKSMSRRIVGIGIAFSLFLLGLAWMFEYQSITTLTDVVTTSLGEKNGLSSYELSLFFTIFVMLQFWNMFNARAYNTGRSAFNFKDCSGFVVIAILIFAGQVAIMAVGGEFFNVIPISFRDWVIIVIGTSPVLLLGELVRKLKK